MHIPWRRFFDGEVRCFKHGLQTVDLRICATCAADAYQAALIPPILTVIVSAFDRTEHLKLLLQCFKLQTRTDFEVVVADNSLTEANRPIAEAYDVRYVPTGKKYGSHECYESAEAVVFREGVRGKYLCFPSDDNWYCVGFVERMIAKIEAEELNLVLCNMLYDPRWSGAYTVVDVKPIKGQCDKGGFVVRRDVFERIGGFPGKNPLPDYSSAADGDFVEAVARIGKVGKVDELLWHHG